MAPRVSFGHVRDPMWAELRARLDEHTDGESGRWDGSRVRAQIDDWRLVLDTYHESTDGWGGGYTRVVAPFVNPAAFRFTIYRKGPFSWLGKLFGMQDVEIGAPEFDDAWIIQGNSPAKLRQFFADEDLRRQLSDLSDWELTLQDDEGAFDRPDEDGVMFDELVLTCAGILAAPAELEQLYRCVAHALSRLCELEEGDR